jgi:hypothetical protein
MVNLPRSARRTAGHHLELPDTISTNGPDAIDTILARNFGERRHGERGGQRAGERGGGRDGERGGGRDGGRDGERRRNAG